MPIPAIDVDALGRNWWAVLLRGVVGILFGIVTFIAPGLSLAALVLAFGFYAIVDGVLSIVSALRRPSAVDHWWVVVLEGLVSLAAGLAVLFWPRISALALLYAVAIWALVTGLFEIGAAIRLRRVITGEWLLVLSGIASIVLAVALFMFPGLGGLALVLWIGAYAFVFGILVVAFSLKLRSWVRTHPAPLIAPG